MSINVKAVTCPSCGASLDVEEGRQQIFCSYCGTKVMIQNENEVVYRHIDEAELKQAETDRMVQMKKLEMAEKSMAANEKTKSLKIKVSIGLGVLMVASFAFSCIGDMNLGGMMVGMFCAMALMMMWLAGGFFGGNSGPDPDGSLRIPMSVARYEGKFRQDVETMLESAGFTNIKCVPLKDLNMGLLVKPGMVATVTVRGEDVRTAFRKKFSPEAPVVITYHDYRQ